MIKIAVVEDEEKEAERIQTVLKQYYEERQIPVWIVFFKDGQEILDHYPMDLDLICLDIEMKQLDGLETARRIRQFDSRVILLFITNLVQYAVEGYRVNAIDFVVKPIQVASFQDRLDRIMTQLEMRKAEFLCFQQGKNHIYLEIHEILYLETYGRKVLIHTKNEVFSCTETMQNLEKRLQSFHFFRCHTAYLVNLAWIDTLDRKRVLIGGQQIPISKYRVSQFMEMMTRYVGKHL